MEKEIELYGWASPGIGDGGETYHNYTFTDEEYEALSKHLTMLVEKDGDNACFEEDDIKKSFPKIYSSMWKFIVARMKEELRECGENPSDYSFGFCIEGDLISKLM